MGEIDQRAFRDAMALFATGVAVISADDGDTAHGITAASFTSVSLKPPLALVCVGLHSPLLPILRRAGAFSAHVLAADQAALATLFAFGDHAARRAKLRREPGAPPRLPGALASFDMTLHAEHPGGDHAVIMGAIEALRISATASASSAPLTWWRGALDALRPR